jgi:hypothetical protein
MPGEAFVEIGLNIKKKCREIGFKNVFIFGLSNDIIGYILPEKEYHKHGYETLVSLFGPKLGLFIEQQEINLAEEIKEKAKWLK